MLSVCFTPKPIYKDTYQLWVNAMAENIETH